MALYDNEKEKGIDNRLKRKPVAQNRNKRSEPSVTKSNTNARQGLRSSNTTNTRNAYGLNNDAMAASRKELQRTTGRDFNLDTSRGVSGVAGDIAEGTGRVLRGAAGAVNSVGNFATRGLDQIYGTGVNTIGKVMAGAQGQTRQQALSGSSIEDVGTIENQRNLSSRSDEVLSSRAYSNIQTQNPATGESVEVTPYKAEYRQGDITGFYDDKGILNITNLVDPDNITKEGYAKAQSDFSKRTGIRNNAGYAKDTDGNITRGFGQRDDGSFFSWDNDNSHLKDKLEKERINYEDRRRRIARFKEAENIDDVPESFREQIRNNPNFSRRKISNPTGDRRLDISGKGQVEDQTIVDTYNSLGDLFQDAADRREAFEQDAADRREAFEKSGSNYGQSSQANIFSKAEEVLNNRIKRIENMLETADDAPTIKERNSIRQTAMQMQQNAINEYMFNREAEINRQNENAKQYMARQKRQQKIISGELSSQTYDFWTNETMDENGVIKENVNNEGIRYTQEFMMAQPNLSEIQSRSIVKDYFDYAQNPPTEGRVAPPEALKELLSNPTQEMISEFYSDYQWLPSMFR
jgi:hypothetical protein